MGIDMIGYFLGGAEKVGSLGFVIETKKNKLLFEYGITPTKPPEYPLPAPKVDYVFVTHAHLDHSGMLPWLTTKYAPRIFGTQITLDLVDLLLRDSLKVMNIEGYTPPFDKTDIENLNPLYSSVSYHKKIYLDDMEIIPYSAGHIPGSTMYKIIMDDKTILFTGDLQTLDTNLINGADIPQADVVVIESTYAGKEHPSRHETEIRFLEKIEETLERNGKVIIPAFAVSRTQELMMVLKKLEREYWVDGMSNVVNDIFAKYGSFLKDSHEFKMARKYAKKVKNNTDRKKAMENGLVIASGGMLEGGPVLNYIDKIRDDEKSSILITGYQVENTNGKMLLDTGYIEINGNKHKIFSEISTFDFSAHAGNSELLKFIENTKAQTVILCHGENREIMFSQLSDKNVISPKNGERFDF